MSLRLDRLADGVLRLTIDRPRAANALDRAVQEALVATLAEAARDDAVRACLLTGAGGRVFSAGADLREDLGPQASRVRRALLGGSLLALLDFPKPMVALLRGKAVGGGVMLALLADEVVMEQAASLHMPEIGLGMPSPVGAAIIAERGGRVAAHAMVQAQRRVGAEEALAFRLADQVLPDAALDAAAEARAAALGALDARAYRINKAWLNTPLRAALERALAEAEARDPAHAD